MYLIIGICLIVLWLVGLVVFKVTKAAIHVVLIVALIALAIHFMR